jgi:hypothetical protein
MDLEVARDDLVRVRVVDPEPAPLAAGQARLRVDRFGFSTNNVTYAVFGETLRYWEFFPAAPGAGDDTAWGRIPVWGFADVVQSTSGDLGAGERLFGYLPISTELVIEVGRAGERTVTDVSAHRSEMAGAYNSYQRCAADSLYRVDREDLQMLLYPLFFTSFVIDDFLADHGDFGAEAVVISSASAKTSIGEAYLARRRGLRAVGLTSAANAAFTASLGVYDRVLAYEESGALERVGSVYVDVSGNGDVRRAVHARLDGVLAHSMVVGDTHWDHQAGPGAGALPGPAPEFLFAPTQIAKRTEEWGADELNARVGAAWDRFCDWVPGWLELRRVAGPDALTDLYRRFLSGRVDPGVGYTATLAEAEVAAR